MKTRQTDTVTSNEDYIRLRIFDGDLEIRDAGAELIRLERAQHEETRRRLAGAQAEIAHLVSR